MEKSFNQNIHDIINHINTFTQRCNERLALERLSFTERYLEGGLEVCFFFPVASLPDKLSSLLPVGEAQTLFEDVAVFRARVSEDARAGERRPGEDCDLVTRYVRHSARENQKPVLVADVEAMEPAEQFVRTRIRPDRAHRFGDLFSGDFY